MIGAVARLPLELDPSGEQARRLFADELAKDEYATTRNIVAEVLDWIAGLFDQVLSGGDPNGSPLAAVTAVLVAAGLFGLVVWLLVRLRRDASAHQGTGAVLGALDLTAEQFRAKAAAAFEAGRYDEALLDWYRALARDAADRGWLVNAAALTAHEVAAQVGQLIPHAASALMTGADDFDRTLYGRGQVVRAQAERMRDLLQGASR